MRAFPRCGNVMKGTYSSCGTTKSDAEAVHLIMLWCASAHWLIGLAGIRPRLVASLADRNLAVVDALLVRPLVAEAGLTSKSLGVLKRLWSHDRSGPFRLR
jgi:hypothetical protein